ncbi:unnamed protein product [Mytilus coruscus]|uniref:HMCN n=1 Tax=Mytilus coruscus TaxID=42192 RepID=A0A6J8BD32_MYTCO|nr:unnamed protein product [Mytilus coruscus]
MKLFLAKSISGFTVGPHSTQIGLVTFSPATTRFNLNTFSSSTAVQNGIKNVPYDQGGTDTHLALRYVGSDSFSTSTGDRANMPDLLVVITDGQSASPPTTIQEADKLKRRHIKIMAIGIGSNVIRKELIDIASNSSLVFEVNNFDALSSTLANKIHSIYCKAVEIITSTTTTTTTTTTIPPTTAMTSTATTPTTSTTTPSQTTITATTPTTTTVTTPTTRTTTTSTTPITPKATTPTIATSTTTTTTSIPLTTSITTVSPTIYTTPTDATTTPTPTTTTRHVSTTSFATANPQDLPQVNIPHQKNTTCYGQPVKIECKVVSSRYPILEVFWEEFDNGITTRIDGKTSGIEGVTISNPSLTIKKPMVNSTYTCKARNAIGTRSSYEFHLIVMGAVYWKAFYAYDRENAKIIHEGDFNTDGITKDNPSLTLKYPKFHDTGEYICYARNEAGQTLSRKISLKVDGVVKANPPHFEVYWIQETYKGKTIIRHGDSGTSGSTTNNPSLTINTTTTTDPGQYTCVAVNVVGNGSSQVTVLNVIGGVPQVTVNSTNYRSIFGDPVTLNCSVQSDPPHTNVYWKHSNDGTNTSNLNHKATGTQGITLQNPSLTIGKTNFAHSGYYTCFASNEIGEGKSESIYLNVTGDYPNVTATTLQYTVDYSNKVTFDCKINATPQHYEVYWLQFINSNFTRKIPSKTWTSSGSTLNIKQVTSSANYSCVAVNAVGEGQSSIITLTVLGGIPKVQRQKLKYKTGKGYSVTINCIVKSEHLKIQNVFWTVYNPRTKRTNEIHNGEVGIDGVSPENPSLIINEVSVSMEGEYTCCAINKAGDACGLPSDLIVDNIEKFVGIIGGILSIIAVLVTAVYNKDKIKGCLKKKEDAGDTERQSKKTNEDQDKIKNRHSENTQTVPTNEIAQTEENDNKSKTISNSNKTSKGKEENTKERLDPNTNDGDTEV